MEVVHRYEFIVPNCQSASFNHYTKYPIDVAQVSSFNTISPTINRRHQFRNKSIVTIIQIYHSITKDTFKSSFNAKFNLTILTFVHVRKESGPNGKQQWIHADYVITLLINLNVTMRKSKISEYLRKRNYICKKTAFSNENIIENWILMTFDACLFSSSPLSHL